MRYTTNINLPIVEDNDLYSKEINNLAFERIDEEIKGLAELVETLESPENSIADVKKNIKEINEQLDNITKYNEVNIKDFGAKLDGITDDSKSLRNSINYLNSVGGGHLKIPNGILYLKEMITDNNFKLFCKITKNIKITGFGKGITIIKVASGENNLNTGFVSIFGRYDNNYMEDVEISNISFDLNGQGNLNQQDLYYFNCAIRSDKARNVIVHDCEFLNVGGFQAIALGYNTLEDSENTRIYNCDFYNVCDTIDNNIIYDQSSIYVVGKDTIIYNNRFVNYKQSIRATAIECDCDNALIYNNYAEKYNIHTLLSIGSNQKVFNNFAKDVITGVMIYTTTNITKDNVEIYGNTFELCDNNKVVVNSMGIDCFTNFTYDVKNMIIKNNNIYTKVNYEKYNNGHTFGMMLRGIKDLVIEGNTINNVAGNGIICWLKNSNNVNINNNLIENVCQGHYISKYNKAIELTDCNILNCNINNNTILNKNNKIKIGISLATIIKGVVKNNLICDVEQDFFTSYIDFENSNIVILHETKNVTQNFNIIMHYGSEIKVLTNKPKIYKKIKDGVVNLYQYGTTPPSNTGYYYVIGDEVINISPNILGEVGKQYIIKKWICTIDGIPGQWKEVRVYTGE